MACARIAEEDVEHHVETFATTTTGLLALGDWLEEHGVTHVAMEATGVYWKPVWHILEGWFELTLANAAHVGPYCPTVTLEQGRLVAVPFLL